MSRFEFDKRWVTEELYESAPLVEMLADLGETIRDDAVRIAGRYNRTGDFQRSIQGMLVRAKNGAPFYRIWSDDPAALTIEFGGSKADKPAHRVLGQAIGKWHDVNTPVGKPSSRRGQKRHIEKSIDAWVASVMKGGK